MKLAYFNSLNASDPLPALGKKVETASDADMEAYDRAANIKIFEKASHRLDDLDAALATALRAVNTKPIEQPSHDGTGYIESEPVTFADVADAQDGWIEWGGGGCPVGVSTAIDVRMRDGSTYEDQVNSTGLRWSHIGSSADIIAYRVIKPAKEEVTKAPTWADYVAAWDSAVKRVGIARTVEACAQATNPLVNGGSRAMLLRPDLWPAAIAALEAL